MTICRVFVSVNVYEAAIVVWVVTVTVKRFVVVTLMVVKLNSHRLGTVRADV